MLDEEKFPFKLNYENRNHESLFTELEIEEIDDSESEGEKKFDSPIAIEDFQIEISLQF